jgi:DNA-binding NarL/FixJ family response regulator
MSQGTRTLAHHGRIVEDLVNPSHLARIVIADGQAPTRVALRLLLQEEPDLEIVGEAADDTEVLALLAHAWPDILILDWELPGQPQAQLVPNLRALDHGMRIIALSGRPESEAAAWDAGVDDFVSKSQPPQTLVAAIRDLADGNEHET